MPRKPKHPTELQSMLNYYGIDLDGTRSEEDAVEYFLDSLTLRKIAKSIQDEMDSDLPPGLDDAMLDELANAEPSTSDEVAQFILWLADEMKSSEHDIYISKFGTDTFISISRISGSRGN